MKKFILLIVLFLLCACSANPVPTEAAQPTSTLLPTHAPTQVAPSATTADTTIPPTPTVIAEPSPEPSNSRLSPIDGMPQVFIPAGTFRMGGLDVRSAPDEHPAHEVTVHAFWMDQLEVTNAMYTLCMQAAICTPPQTFKSLRRLDYFENSEYKDYPVVYVTWGQAKTYCEWAERRLPTEAEWERAARGDDWRTFPWGEDKANGLLANYNMIVGDTSRVGTYPLGASPFGVLDMAGNVAEWTNDFYSPTIYETSADATDPRGPASSASLRRVVRGGSLGDAEINIRVPKRSAVLGSDLNAAEGSSAYRGDFSPRIGFRCAADE